MSCWLAIVARLGVLGVPHEAQALSDTPRARAARGSGRAELSVVAVSLRDCVSLNFAAALIRAGRSSAHAFSIAGLISSHDSPAVRLRVLRRSVASCPFALSCWASRFASAVVFAARTLSCSISGCHSVSSA